MVVAKAMNVKVKVEKEVTVTSIVEGFKKALKTLEAVKEGKAVAKPNEDLLNEL